MKRALGMVEKTMGEAKTMDNGEKEAGCDLAEKRGIQIGTPSVFNELICPKALCLFGIPFLLLQSYLNSLV
jgi:hypothetical protein